MTDKYILDGHEPKAVDLMTWAAWIETADRRVDRTQIGDVDISTVFLTIDHNFGYGPPVLFETMIFGGEHDQYCERCTTWDEAVEQHKRAIDLVEGRQT